MTKNVKPFKNLPSILSFNRRLESSDGLLFSGKWKNINEKEIKFIDSNKSNDNKSDNTKFYWRKINSEKRGNIGTKSQYKLGKGKRIDPNPVQGAKASLFDGDDTLKLNFNLKILGNVGVPTACNNSNDSNFSNILLNVVNNIKSNGGLQKLAYRYAYNIANGRFLWRNRLCAEEIEIHVYNGAAEDSKPLVFNAFDFSLKNIEENDNVSLVKLADLIFNGLMNDDGFTFLKVDAFAKMGNRAQIFPSQIMNIGDDEKVLFTLGDYVGMHDVKIGNAIRTIDTWYPEYDGENHMPIAVDPFGIVTQIGKAYRDNNKKDLYTYLKNLPIRETAESLNDDDLFFMANLIRGGLFQGESGKE